MKPTAAPQVIEGTTHATREELIAMRYSARRLRLRHTRGHQHASGGQKSHLYGRGMDYAESRVYQAGDDVRRLDWRLTARSGKLHTKLFQEDRQSQFIILLDTHATMNFGTRQRFKSVQAARAAALAAWLVSSHGEQIGLIGFGQQALWCPPVAGNRGVLSLCQTLADTSQTSSANHFQEALWQLKKSGVHPGRLLLISDGLGLKQDDLARLVLFSRHADLSLLGIADRLEAAPAVAGHYTVSLEGKRQRLALTGQRRQAFFQQLNRGQQTLGQFAAQHGLAYQQLTVDAHPATVLPALLGKMRRR